jgi:hypothetical protein
MEYNPDTLNQEFNAILDTIDELIKILKAKQNDDRGTISNKTRIN